MNVIPPCLHGPAGPARPKKVGFMPCVNRESSLWVGAAWPDSTTVPCLAQYKAGSAMLSYPFSSQYVKKHQNISLKMYTADSYIVERKYDTCKPVSRGTLVVFFNGDINIGFFLKKNILIRGAPQNYFFKTTLSTITQTQIFFKDLC